MKILILTYGSRGDVQPFVALALGLQRAGHAVRLAAPQRFATLAAQHNVPFLPLAGDPAEMSAYLNDAGHNALRMVQAMSDYVSSIAIPVIEAVAAACEDADLLVHSFLFTTGGHSLARKLHIPDVSVQLFPTFAPTRAFPMVASANLPAGRLSYVSHWLTKQIFWHVGNWSFRRLRRSQPALFDFSLYWPFAAASSPQTPLLFAYSPTVLPRPAEWTAVYIHIPGYFFLETAVAYQPPPQLLDFLQAGTAPLCVSFGSMVNRDAARIDAIVRAALAETGQRAIILSGWGGAEQAATRDADANLLYLDAVPHDWLLPQCHALIHHGGAGTTAAGLRAGIPNILIPHGMDQPFWGRQVAALGAGPKPITLRKLDTGSLIDALTQVNSSAMRARAQEVGRQIRAEDGVGQAVRIIEQHAAAFSPS
ncbi:MAG: glycosyltransferase [Chloroflexota bacterium]